MVDVVCYKDEGASVIDPDLITLAAGHGRCRLSFLYRKGFKRIPQMGLTTVQSDRMNEVPYDVMIASSSVFEVKDRVVTKICNYHAKEGDMFQFEYQLKANPLRLGFKVQLKSNTTKSGWSQWFVSEIPPFVRLFIRAPKEAFTVMDLRAVNRFIFLGPSKAMAKRHDLLCCICFDTDVQFLTYQCGHMVCAVCDGKNRKLRQSCHSCMVQVEETWPMRLWEDACPIDDCDHDDKLFTLTPCGCAFFHPKEIDQLVGKPCPFKFCGRPVEKIITMYKNDDL